jgi:hypothetical protein
MNEEHPRLRGMKQVAELLRIPYGRLYRLIRSGQLPEATYIISRRRIFTDDDVLALWASLRAMEAGVTRYYPERRLQDAA